MCVLQVVIMVNFSKVLWVVLSKEYKLGFKQSCVPRPGWFGRIRSKLGRIRIRVRVDFRGSDPDPVFFSRRPDPNTGYFLRVGFGFGQKPPGSANLVLSYAAGYS